MQTLKSNLSRHFFWLPVAICLICCVPIYPIRVGKLYSTLGCALIFFTGVHPPKPMMNILPYFHKIYKFCPSYFRKIYIIFSHISAKYTPFLFNLHFLIPFYFENDAFMHHALHVLDCSILHSTASTNYSTLLQSIPSFVAPF